MLALLAAAPASAGGWLAPGDISEAGESADEVQVASDPAGDSIVVWERYAGKRWFLESAYRSTGGKWQAPVPIAEGAEDPQLAFDAAGDAVLIWRLPGESSEVVQSAFRPAGGEWEAPVTISKERPHTFSLALAMNASGDAVAVWAIYEEGVAKSVEGASRLAGGEWQGGLAVAGEPPDWDPDVGIDGAGNALAVWRTYSPSLDECLVQSAARPAGGEWEAPQTIATELYPGKGPRLAMNEAGDAVVAWGRYQGPPRQKKPGGSPPILCEAKKGATEEVRGASKSVGEEWGGTIAFSEKAEGKDPQAAIDASGHPLVVWEASGAIQSTSSGGSVTISNPATNSFRPKLAMNSQGDAVATWLTIEGLTDQRQAAVKTGSAGWGPLSNISAPEEEVLGAVSPAIDGSGNATAAWIHLGEATQTIQSATYDATAPTLQALSIPTTGTAGEPLSFSVSPLDTWSALGPTSWDFGDGSTGLGTSVAHAYSAPGSYHVTLSSTDAVGNTTHADGVVTIAPGAETAPAPTISRLGQSSPVWREPGSLPSASSSRLRRVPLGTTFTFVLDQGATVKLSFHRIGSGRAGALTLSAHSGTNKTGFRGKVTAVKRLKPGRYTLTATAVNRNGSSAPRSLGFRIVKPGR